MQSAFDNANNCHYEIASLKLKQKPKHMTNRQPTL